MSVPPRRSGHVVLVMKALLRIRVRTALRRSMSSRHEGGENRRPAQHRHRTQPRHSHASYVSTLTSQPPADPLSPPPEVLVDAAVCLSPLAIGTTTWTKRTLGCGFAGATRPASTPGFRSPRSETRLEDRRTRRLSKNVWTCRGTSRLRRRPAHSYPSWAVYMRRSGLARAHKRARYAPSGQHDPTSGTTRGPGRDHHRLLDRSAPLRRRRHRPGRRPHQGVKLQGHQHHRRPGSDLRRRRRQMCRSRTSRRHMARSARREARRPRYLG